MLEDWITIANHKVIDKSKVLNTNISTIVNNTLPIILSNLSHGLNNQTI